MGEFSKTLEMIKQINERMLVIITEAMEMTSDNEVDLQRMQDLKSPFPLIMVSTANHTESGSVSSGRLTLSLFPHMTQACGILLTSLRL